LRQGRGGTPHAHHRVGRRYREGGAVTICGRGEAGHPTPTTGSAAAIERGGLLLFAAGERRDTPRPPQGRQPL
jgi:hypothetical protein